MSSNNNSGILRVAIVLATVALVGRPCPCATYYVDADMGSDLSPGTSPGDAWQTLARVSSFAFEPGDSVLLRRDCQWREQLYIHAVGTEARPILFGAYGGGEPPLINAADVYATDDWAPAGQNIWSKAGHVHFDPDFALTERAANKFIVTIDGQRFLPVTDINDLRENTYAYDGTSDTLFVYLTSDPDGHVTESATRNNSIHLYKSEHIVLQDLEVMNSTRNNVYLQGCTHILCQRLTVHHAGTRGITVAANLVDGVAVGWAEYITIQDCEIYHNGVRCDTAANDIGLGLNVRRVTIRRNLLYGDGANWGVDGVLTGEDARGAGHLIEDNVSFDHCENEIDLKGHWESPAGEGRTVIRNNLLSGSRSAIIAIHVGSRDVDIEFNHLYGGATYGIGIYNHNGSTPYDGQEGDLTIAYNVIRDNLLSAIMDHGNGHATTAGGNRVYNNVLVRNARDFHEAALCIESPHWDVRNNIIWDNGDRTVASQIAAVTAEASTSLVESHNLVAQDPLFMNAESNDFRLRAGSPAIDAGAFLGYDKDLDGEPVPVGSAPDIGAYEYPPPEEGVSADGQ